MKRQLDRRQLLTGFVALGGAAVTAKKAHASLHRPGSDFLHWDNSSEKRLAFRNVHTDERIDARFFGKHGYDERGLAEINHGLRDWRTGDITEVDTDLLNLLVSIRDRLDISPNQPFDLICGYRSPLTNRMLHERRGRHSGVATHSQHLLGKATDIAMPGVPLARLRMAAEFNQQGGVGYYPEDGFIHVDTGPVRSWRG
ncbi:MAG: DUF882 domain-containing protein [Zymomonas mobilis subsp. pomaceae]|uniref:Murein endopeptidase K n=1 Tax=Zymomonas mobilis subsp. pomaceae (strain ATCC 29192 / DSM 22645 / JCM 10191 / CCUG 17912 / NBRC 13757 / NCIMB 11200 / NRRL B-4491 / Barker I) TaxID=579138 RepID=F8ESI5_ZYMMT|nr:DUF882 domain-containing protein [Zymomonas mobilis]AEI37760.1 protein of unknown function DUF882 [Zymomonas mobilis subsp. pomaceae ATCC 29192]MDX5949127.1 DUF882 domain-containing protein [Zymomonas mobilis subsp. pomaceae]GEB88934.1 membrane protein [Zymomonas mobilis subsp. pomaceae]